MGGRLKTILVYFGLVEDERVEARVDESKYGMREVAPGVLGLAITFGVLFGVKALIGGSVDGDDLGNAAAFVVGALLIGGLRIAWDRWRPNERPPDGR